MPKIKILSAGYVSALKMYAPIVNPVIVPSSSIPSILRERHKVIEYNSKGKALLLTMDNYSDPHRFDEPKVETQEEKPAADVPVENPYGNDVTIDTEAAVFTGYTANTVMEVEPPKVPATETTKLTKAQRRALAKAKREEEAAKAAEEASATEEAPVTEETATEVSE